MIKKKILILTFSSFFLIQIKRDKEKGIEIPAPVYTEFVRKDEEEKGIFNIFILFLSICYVVQVSFNQNLVAEKKKILP